MRTIKPEKIVKKNKKIIVDLFIFLISPQFFLNKPIRKMTKIATTINGKIISSVIVLGKSLTYVEFVTTTLRDENTDGIRAAKITTDIIIRIA